MDDDNFDGLKVLFNDPEINVGDLGESIPVNFTGMKPITLKIPNVERKNSLLFAHHVWKASVLVSKTLLEIGNLKGLDILELGSGSGLPSIIASNLGGIVTASDYPDEDLIKMLELNLKSNTTSSYSVMSHIWGDRAKDCLFPSAMPYKQFDIILMADTLWMKDQHENLLNDLKLLLKPSGRVIGCAGLHSGKSTFQEFFQTAESETFGFKCLYCQPYRIPSVVGLAENEIWEQVGPSEIIPDTVYDRQWFLFNYVLEFSNKLDLEI
ncbi:hypothetical protein HDV02_001508 [Globomyces sp. JEL0801]|nr:hypothetical protein HDV02_001508 [Globomyces sp. JEL0801]